MNAETLYTALRAREMSLSVVGDRLALTPRELLTDADRAALRTHKAEIIELLAKESADTAAPPIANTFAVGDLVDQIDGDGFSLGYPPARVVELRDVAARGFGGLGAVLDDPGGSWVPTDYLRRVGREVDDAPR